MSVAVGVHQLRGVCGCGQGDSLHRRSVSGEKREPMTRMEAAAPLFGPEKTCGRERRQRMVSLRPGFVAITCCSTHLGTTRTSPDSTMRADKYTRSPVGQVQLAQESPSSLAVDDRSSPSAWTTTSTTPERIT